VEVGRKGQTGKKEEKVGKDRRKGARREEEEGGATGKGGDREEWNLASTVHF